MWKIEEKITLGWSEDEKYRVTLDSGEKALLRISAPETLPKKRAEFAALQRLAPLGLPVQTALEAGATKDRRAYMLFSWVEGEMAEAAIPKLPPGEQYAAGRQAGALGRKIHALPAPDDQMDWEERFNKKIDRNMRLYAECPVKVDGMDGAARYLEANRHLLAGRPQSFQQGDFHAGNMLVDKAGTVWLIDFNRMDFGDPWEEFNRIPFSVNCGRHFATGMVDGYFGGEPPEDFFRLLALYIASNQLASVPWGVSFGGEEVENMVRLARIVLADYDNFTRIRPRWYTAYGLNRLK